MILARRPEDDFGSFVHWTEDPSLGDAGEVVARMQEGHPCTYEVIEVQVVRRFRVVRDVQTVVTTKVEELE